MEIVSKENAEHYLWGSNCDGWHFVKSTSLSIIQERVPPGASEVRHIHEYAEQFFFVLFGVATIEVAGQVFGVEPNQGLHVPAGVPHRLSNEESEELIFLVSSTPPSHGDRVEA